MAKSRGPVNAGQIRIAVDGGTDPVTDTESG